jgi:hypothetical protein
MMAILTWTARVLFNTEDNIATPSWVNTYGNDPPKLRREGITICDTKISASSAESWNIKSAGNRRRFRFTC